MKIIYSYYAEQYLFKFKLEPEAIAHYPQWLAEEDYPPLSPRLAIAESLKLVQQLLKDFPQAEPELYCCSLCQDPNSQLWYYSVDWLVWPPQAGDKTTLSIPVLLDGCCPDYQCFAYQDRFDAYGLN